MKLDQAFDKFDKNQNGVMDVDELAKLCSELNVKPWKVMKHARNLDKTKTVTKTVFLNYWFNAHKRRGFKNAEVKPPRRRTGLRKLTEEEYQESRRDASRSEASIELLRQLDEKLVSAIRKDRSSEVRDLLKQMRSLISIIELSQEQQGEAPKPMSWSAQGKPAKTFERAVLEKQMLFFGA